ncbi:hypothetical protein [Isoptericola sp. QY 916]|uniref:hypothetical protein n=1 Tax=Isoptericola sp. QY 916 TaxID=2782570 RepID=UPI003D2FA845|nr:hypothetical protein [Isoptericola sp. QY 916]
MITRPLGEWAVLWADEHDVPVDVVEADARAHLEDLAELDGVPRGEIHTWHVTEAAARRLLDGLEVSRRRRAR